MVTRRRKYRTWQERISERACYTCNQVKPISEFYQKHEKGLVIMEGTCKACKLEKTANRLKERVELINRIKNVPCKDCNQRFPPECMDFDHLSDKKFGIAARKLTNLDLLLNEIAKCDIVCSNCHRIRTKNRNTKKYE